MMQQARGESNDGEGGDGRDSSPGTFVKYKAYIFTLTVLSPLFPAILMRLARGRSPLCWFPVFSTRWGKTSPSISIDHPQLPFCQHLSSDSSFEWQRASCYSLAWNMSWRACSAQRLPSVSSFEWQGAWVQGLFDAMRRGHPLCCICGIYLMWQWGVTLSVASVDFIQRNEEAPLHCIWDSFNAMERGSPCHICGLRGGYPCSHWICSILTR